MAELVNNQPPADVEKLAQCVREVTNCSLDVAHLALEDCSYDSERAIDHILTVPKVWTVLLC